MNSSDKDSSGRYQTIDNVCNAEFLDPMNADCNDYAEQGMCNNSADFYLQMTRAKNVRGQIQTGLNCPQCGCNVNPKVGFKLNSN